MKRNLLNQRRVLAALVVVLLVLSMLPAQYAQFISRSPRHLVEVIITPISHPVRTLVLKFYDKPTADEETLESLREERDNYHRWAYKLQLELDEQRALNQQFTQFRQLFGDQSNLTFVKAAVVTGSMVFGQPTLRINRGSKEGLEVGQVVSQGSSLVGRLVDVGPVSATVQLITSPQTRLQVRIVPPGTNLHRQVEAIIEVAPDGQSFEGIVNANRPVEVGDIAYLADNNWPREGFIVGQVVSAEPSTSDPLRLSVRIEPQKSLQTLSTVTVLVYDINLPGQTPTR